MRGRRWAQARARGAQGHAHTCGGDMPGRVPGASVALAALQAQQFRLSRAPLAANLGAVAAVGVFVFGSELFARSGGSS